MPKITTQLESDGTWTAFVEGKDTAWTGTATEDEAIAAVKALHKL